MKLQKQHISEEYKQTISLKRCDLNSGSWRGPIPHHQVKGEITDTRVNERVRVRVRQQVVFQHTNWLTSPCHMLRHVGRGHCLDDWMQA